MKPQAKEAQVAAIKNKKEASWLNGNGVANVRFEYFHINLSARIPFVPYMTSFITHNFQRLTPNYSLIQAGFKQTS